jgi:cobalt-zinc-cadmium efflux system outer membrane protein
MVVGASMPIQFFNRNQGGRLRAANRLQQAGEQQRAAELRINAALTRGHLTLSNAYTKATELKNNVLQNAERLFEAASVGYEYGKFDYLHLLDAQRTLFEAKRQYLESVATCHKARADVERLTGQSIDVSEEGESETLSEAISQGGN